MTSENVASVPPRRAYLDGLQNYEHTESFTDEDPEVERCFAVQRARYGFDARQTWSLDYAMVKRHNDRMRRFPDEPVAAS